MKGEKKYEEKILTMLLVSMIGLSVTGCGGDEPMYAHIESSDGTSSDVVLVIGRDALVEIDGNLYYDSTTGIVYWWNGFLGCDWATTPTPYYSANGLLFRYIPETKTFEEISPAKGE